MSLSRRSVLAAGAVGAIAPTAAIALPAGAGPVPLSPEARRILELEPIFEQACAASNRFFGHEPGAADAIAVTDALHDEFEALCRVIHARPITSLSDVVDRAIIARWAADQNADGSWGDLQNGLYDNAMAEAALSVLILAGLTDGKVERHGHPGCVASVVEAN